MRGVMVALLSALVAGLMLLPGSVSAGTLTMVVEDPEGDLGFGVDMKTSEIARALPESFPLAGLACLDIVSVSLSLKKDVYTFKMEVAAALPDDGAALPNGVKTLDWAMYIDPSPFHVSENPVAPLYLFDLRYDESGYNAFMVDFGTLATTPMAVAVDGSEIQLSFTAASIGDIALEWWSPMNRAWFGPPGSSGYWWVDAIDFGTVPGQVYYDLPWPP